MGIAKAPDWAGTARTDVCVIGSGAGGGVAAALLAEAGRDVMVLEEGQHVTRERMTQREEQMYPLLYRDGGNQHTADGSISVLQGRCLGGSTVVNMADVVPVPQGVLDHWRQAFGLTRYSDEAWHQAGRQAMAAIGANRIPSDRVNRNGQLLLDGAAAQGLSGGTFIHNRVDCIGSGYCTVGCAYDAKKSVALTFIPRALRTGRTTVVTQARVTRLDRSGRRVTHVRGTLSDGRPFSVEADHVILAAGAVHSPLILRASGLGGRRVGQHLSLQPQAPVSALYEDDVVMYRGIPQSTYIDSTEWANGDDGLAGFRVESVTSTPGMAAASAPIWGPQNPMHYRRIAASLCLVPDRPGGQVKRKRNGRPAIRYALQRLWGERMLDAIRVASIAYLRTGATQVMLPFVGAPPVTDESQLERLGPLRPNSLPLISAHPQGTCRLGEVLEQDFHVKGLDNLQVLDASVFPTTASSHTMLPVMQAAMLGVSELL